MSLGLEPVTPVHNSATLTITPRKNSRYIPKCRECVVNLKKKLPILVSVRCLLSTLKKGKKRIKKTIFFKICFRQQPKILATKNGAYANLKIRFLSSASSVQIIPLAVFGLLADKRMTALKDKLYLRENKLSKQEFFFQLQIWSAFTVQLYVIASNKSFIPEYFKEMHWLVFEKSPAQNFKDRRP